MRTAMQWRITASLWRFGKSRLTACGKWPPTFSTPTCRWCSRVLLQQSRVRWRGRSPPIIRQEKRGGDMRRQARTKEWLRVATQEDYLAGCCLTKDDLYHNFRRLLRY